MIEFKQKFVDDASDLLADLELTLLTLDKDPNNSKVIEEVFRVMHTLKGTSSMYGFDRIGKLTHRLENIYDLVRNGRLAVNKQILDLTLEAVDLLNKDLKSADEENLDENYTICDNHISDLLSKIDENYFDSAKQEIENINKQAVGTNTWFITIKPENDLQKRGIKMHLIFDEFDLAGQNIVFNRTKPQNGEAAIFWEVILATNIQKSDIEDILLFIEDISTINLLAEINLFQCDFFSEKAKELSTAQFIVFEDLQCFVNQNLQNKNDIKSDAKAIKIESRHLESIKVAADRLDEQMTLLSELVTVKAEIQLMVQKNGYKELMKPVEQLEKITRRFRRNIFKIRLMPLETLQLRFDRLIRDLTKQLDKQVDFYTEGMNTELDKTIIDSLESPIMHLIRNCLDHGIETADIRKMRGKPGHGTIKLVARQAAATVVIIVSDDGEGINTSKVFEKAVEKGIVEKNDRLTESQLFDLIFMHGFSTAGNLSEVSGRGVGMDVVKQTISNLRGTIDIESEKGKGTNFIIKLPLTLSIIDTMLVRAGSLYYSIPLSSIDKCTEIQSTEINKYDNKHISISKQLLPYIVVNQKLKISAARQLSYDEQTSTNSLKWKVVVVRNELQKTALIVDEVIGEHQAVLKPIGDYFKNLNYISGATQLADGRIAFVLDVPRLINSF